MVDYPELMRLLSAPRPNGSAAVMRTYQALLDWLEQRQVPHRSESFLLFPYFFQGIGGWLILSRTLLALAIWDRWGWPTLALAILGMAGGLVDVLFNLPLVTWFGATQGHNILVEFSPPQPERELVLSAHYDSKTELLDHRQRMFFVKNLRFGILLTVLLGLLGPLDAYLLHTGSPWASWTYAVGVFLSLPLLFLAWGLGLNMTLGSLAARLGRASAGAVDNGAACAILLGLAERLQQGELALERTKLVLALFAGEEVNMQGSQAYTRQRDWPLPAAALNLEVMAQDGDYVLWEQDGLSLKLWPCSAEMNQRAAKAVKTVTGATPRLVGPVNSDAGSFLRAGIPATTLGTYDRALVDRGFHGPQDHPGRVVMERLPEAVQIMAQFIRDYDGQEIHAPA